MGVKEYVAPSFEALEMSPEAILCASGADSIDFSTLGSESIDDSGYKINWGE